MAAGDSNLGGSIVWCHEKAEVALPQELHQQGIQALDTEGPYVGSQLGQRLSETLFAHARPFHTSIGAKGGNGILGPASKVLLPSLIRLPVRVSTLLDSRLGLANHVLAVEDEERLYPVLLELVKVLGQVGFDAGEAAEGRQEGLMVGRVVEEEMEVVGSAYRDGAVGDGVQAVGPMQRQTTVSREGRKCWEGGQSGEGSSRVLGTYVTCELIQESSVRAGIRSTLATAGDAIAAEGG